MPAIIREGGEADLQQPPRLFDELTGLDELMNREVAFANRLDPPICDGPHV